MIDRIKTMKKIFSLILFIFLFSLNSYAKAPKTHIYYEKDYQKVWCDKNCGQTEVVLADKTRVDCVTKIHAIEFDFASKWAESIGQSLYYANILNKSPGIVLIVEDDIKDQKYINRASLIAKKYSINLWIIRPSDMTNK